MNRIYRLNITGISAGAAALIAAGALAAGCAPASSPRFAPSLLGTNTTYPVNTSALPQNAQGLYDIGTFNQQQQAQLTGILGNYTGTFWAYDSEGNKQTVGYTLSLTKGTSASSPGKTYVQANLSAGQFSFSSLVQTTVVNGAFGGGSVTFSFDSLPQNIPAFDTNSGQVYLVLELSLNTANQFDPTLSAGNNHGLGPIRIVDSWSLDDVASFYNDFQRH